MLLHSHPPAVNVMGTGPSNPEVLTPQKLHVKAAGRQESELAGEALSEQRESGRQHVLIQY